VGRVGSMSWPMSPGGYPADVVDRPPRPFPGQGIAVVAWLVILTIWSVVLSCRARLLHLFRGPRG
jgi:hypothetical protein